MNEKIVNKELVYQLLKGVLTENQILVDEPLKNHTTFKVGGPADFLILPDNIAKVEQCVKLCNESSIPYYIIGNGSNLLVSDKGYRGIIIKIAENLSKITVKVENKEDNCKTYYVTAEAGILLSELSKVIASHECTGFEFASGIPGTLGGAVTMNAGAYDGEIKDCIVEATIMEQDGSVHVLSKEELKLSYRKSIIQERSSIVLDATFIFQTGCQEIIDAKIADLTFRREDKQPLEYPSAGSTFKRPEGYYASKLIMDAGLRGYRYGSACVSEKHCGFVINDGDATAEEILILIGKIIEIIKNKDGVTLEPEVRLLGEF